ncbi:MAG: AraC family transcriptional regulator [Chitinophagaceae bacterium]|nr:MAG: AraC family transcriptional regulator [Chitinophagaceae bacterium]
MKRLVKGEFFGETNRTIHLDGLTLTDTVYTHDTVDWHYHEHAYFTFILQGAVIEGNKNETCECPAGTLLFHNWQEPHYNSKPPGFTRGFHVEIEQEWLTRSQLDVSVQGSFRVDDPSARLMMYQVAAETQAFVPSSGLAVQSLLLNLLSGIADRSRCRYSGSPLWVAKLKEILHAHSDNPPSLSQLSVLLQVHPVHLSRDFSKYFHCTMGEYLRKLKVTRSLGLLGNREQSLTNIAFECGFADQSHFVRCFREQNGTTPSVYRRLLFG